MTGDLAEVIRKATTGEPAPACHYCDSPPVIHLAYGCSRLHVNIRHLCATCASDMEQILENREYRCHDCGQPYTCWMSRDREGFEHWREIT